MIPLEELQDAASLREADPAALAELARLGNLRVVSAGEPLFEQGAPAENVFLLLSGWGKVTQVNRDGKQALVRLVGPGEFCGLAFLLDRPDHPGTFRAIVPARAAAWPLRSWRRVFQANAGLAAGLLDTLAPHVAESHVRITELSTEETERRIARTVLRLARRVSVPTPGGLLIALPITRQELAELNGTTLHNVSRIVSAWAANRVVESGRRRLVVRDMEALQRIAGTRNSLPPPDARDGTLPLRAPRRSRARTPLSVGSETPSSSRLTNGGFGSPAPTSAANPFGRRCAIASRTPPGTGFGGFGDGARRPGGADRRTSAAWRGKPGGPRGSGRHDTGHPARNSGRVSGTE